MIRRLLTVLGLAALAIYSVIRATRPPRIVPASAPDSVFSAERALRHVAMIAERPHAMGMADHDRVRDYVQSQLASLGLRTEIQTTTAIGTRYQSAGRVQNVIGYLPGSAPSGKVLLLVVHYDGVPAGPAAADDGAGVAALLETLRALRARHMPLRQDVIALFTDGEECGLLGAAAFVREHPRAHDVAFALNFEARGTEGRAYMFETGPGNLDAARVLRAAGDVTAGSVFTTVYRALPNDTDLSELSLLAIPALNFAFTGGVERYHTTRDDVAHLDGRSVQHHGAQMLALAKTIGDGPLPRPATGDGVFFDLPMIGLVVYPLWLTYVLAAASLVLFILVAPRSWRVAGAALISLLAIVFCALIASRLRLSGHAMWSWPAGSAVALAAIAVNAGVYLFVERRWESARVGGLAIWLLLALAASVAAPAISYLFLWPLLFALIAARSRHPVAEWISAAMALLLLAGTAFTAGTVLLGLNGVGAIALVTFASLITWIIGPLVQQATSDWRVASGAPLLASAIIALAARSTSGAGADHPVRSSLVFAENAMSKAAFLGTPVRGDRWARSILPSSKPGPFWTTAAGDYRELLVGAARKPLSLEAASVRVERDSITGDRREVTFRVNAPAGTTSLTLHVAGVAIASWAIDGREVATNRFRARPREWTAAFWNPPAEGVLVTLRMPSSSHGALEVVVRRPGIPGAIAVPARPEWSAPSQNGDVTAVYSTTGF
jgi:hypothetical protein